MNDLALGRMFTTLLLGLSLAGCSVSDSQEERSPETRKPLKVEYYVYPVITFEKLPPLASEMAGARPENTPVGTVSGIIRVRAWEKGKIRPGIRLSPSVAEGDASMAHSPDLSQQTDKDGIGRFRVRYGRNPGIVKIAVEAHAADVPEPLWFELEALPSPKGSPPK